MKAGKVFEQFIKSYEWQELVLGDYDFPESCGSSINFVGVRLSPKFLAFSQLEDKVYRAVSFGLDGSGVEVFEDDDYPRQQKVVYHHDIEFCPSL